MSALVEVHDEGELLVEDVVEEARAEVEGGEEIEVGDGEELELVGLELDDENVPLLVEAKVPEERLGRRLSSAARFLLEVGSMEAEGFCLVDRQREVGEDEEIPDAAEEAEVAHLNVGVVREVEFGRFFALDELRHLVVLFAVEVAELVEDEHIESKILFDGIVEEDQRKVVEDVEEDEKIIEGSVRVLEFEQE